MGGEVPFAGGVGGCEGFEEVVQGGGGGVVEGVVGEVACVAAVLVGRTAPDKTPSCITTKKKKVRTLRAQRRHLAVPDPSAPHNLNPLPHRPPHAPHRELHARAVGEDDDGAAAAAVEGAVPECWEICGYAVVVVFFFCAALSSDPALALPLAALLLRFSLPRSTHAARTAHDAPPTPHPRPPRLLKLHIRDPRPT